MFYKPSEVAKKLRVSPETVRNLCRNGQIQHFRVGSDRGAIRIPTESLQAYLEQSQQSAKTTELPTVRYINLPGLKH